MADARVNCNANPYMRGKQRAAWSRGYAEIVAARQLDARAKMACEGAWLIPAGIGYRVGQDFNRTAADTLIELAPREHADAGHIIGYIPGEPASGLAFMRPIRVRVHVRRDLLRREALA